MRRFSVNSDSSPIAETVHTSRVVSRLTFVPAFDSGTPVPPYLTFRTNAIFETSEFPTCNGSEGQPPGKELAQALGAGLADAGFEVAQLTIDSKRRWWKNDYWYFFVSAFWKKYRVKVQYCNKEGIWRVAFSEASSIRSFFLKRYAQDPMPAWLQLRTEALIRYLTNCREVSWITERQAIERFF